MRTPLAALAVVLIAAGARAFAADPGVVEGERGMVVTAQHEASEVGRHILEAGGNAIAAAVAVGYALAVVDPCCGNIGGGGFMLIHRADGRDSVVNFRETAPRAASRAAFASAAASAAPSTKPSRASATAGAMTAARPSRP